MRGRCFTKRRRQYSPVDGEKIGDGDHADRREPIVCSWPDAPQPIGGEAGNVGRFCSGLDHYDSSALMDS